MYFLWTPKESTKERRRYFQSAGHGQGDQSPWTPKYVGRGRAGLKNRQDTFFDAPPTRSRLTAPPKKCGENLWLLQYYGSSVGAAYMPPVATAPVMRYTGQTARDASMRPLQTCRKYHIITEYGDNKIHHPVGAGHAPPATVYYNESCGLACRGGH